MTMTNKKKNGRPTKYKERTANAICARLMMGESLISICNRKYYPAKRTVMYWLTRHERFMHQYREAREFQQEFLYEEMFDIADDGSNDWMEKRKKDGDVEIVLDREHVSRSKLRIETRMWAMARMAPKRYGDKKQVEHSGKVDIAEMDDEAIDAKLAKLLNKNA